MVRSLQIAARTLSGYNGRYHGSRVQMRPSLAAGKEPIDAQTVY